MPENQTNNKPSSTSPCVKICQLNSENECIGCGRTLNEIAKWAVMTEKDREKVLKRLKEKF